jgi:hypothetical protein
MVTKFLTVCFFILIAFHINGQNKALIFINKFTYEEKKIHEGKMIKVICNDNTLHKGKLNILNDSTIKIDSTYLTLDKIKSIKVKLFSPTGESLTIAGGSLILNGSAAIIVLQIFEFGLNTLWAITLLEVITLTPVGLALIVPGIVLLTIYRNFDREKWTYKLMTR